ncbi:CpaF family protein [Vibrio sp. S4M6]|uniref:CpaF family protein n=1 Tax=Vibrio sinus TaxID=2946865 RepID=UPI00202A7EAD|nr:CpaF family protein [Vibrio sinus]MCL9783352.1 CpaF family protein [Vibrio sinus]
MQKSKSIYISIREKIFEALDPQSIKTLTKEQLTSQITNAVDLIIDHAGYSVTSPSRIEFVKHLVDELIGLGPLQTLLEDESINDIMINGPMKVFIERAGILEESTVKFIDENQLQNIAKRMAATVGRRVDESTPTCDARLLDGSRVNIVIPPVAIDGTCISIRKFKKHSLNLDMMAEYGSMSRQMANLLKIAARCRLNIIISGGTGSGKTTLLNALSQFISNKERIITIEDAAELRILQPHVARLETRTEGIEGNGAVTQRDLVINALRMRPDRIVVGECRGAEAFEMLQAMNTGHDGSMSTLHANTPRDAIARIESMVMMATSNLPLEAIRRTVVSAVDIIVQISRLHDGSRKVMSVSEVVGLEGSTVVMEELFKFTHDGNTGSGKVNGKFITPGLSGRSVLSSKASFFGLNSELKSVFSTME